MNDRNRRRRKGEDVARFIVEFTVPPEAKEDFIEVSASAWHDFARRCGMQCNRCFIMMLVITSRL